MAAMVGGDWPALTDAEEKMLGERYAEEIARDFDPQSQVKAMDKEGLDLAILFPTAAMYATAFTRMDPRFAAAVSRAYNDWLYDYIQAADPKRMFGAAAVSPHDVDSAVAETRRAVTELGMKAIFIRPNIHNERPWHHRYYDPLWSVCQELNVPVGNRCPERHGEHGVLFKSTGQTAPSPIRARSLLSVEGPASACCSAPRRPRIR